MDAMAACPTTLPLREREQVRLNMYDIGTLGGGSCLNSLLRSLGTGIFHCGVEVYDQEWSYSDTTSGRGTGVFPCQPRTCRGHTFSETVIMGCTARSRENVLLVIEKSKIHWRSCDYHVLQHNCCHYSNELCLRLGVGAIPKRILNMSEMGAACVAGKWAQECLDYGGLEGNDPIVAQVPPTWTRHLHESMEAAAAHSFLPKASQLNGEEGRSERPMQKWTRQPGARLAEEV